MDTLRFEDLTPGEFKQARVEGGLPKLIRIWDYLRVLNKGGYGGATLVQIKNTTQRSPVGVTSCSPFTATVLLMALDPRPVDVGSPYALPEPYEPQFDGIGSRFYAMHNGFAFSGYGSTRKDHSIIWNPGFKAYAARIPQLPTSINFNPREPDPNRQRWAMINDSAGSCVVHNLGEAKAASQMRRGDMVGIDWHNGHGHATFCWNVHLNAKGDVDCFQFVSSNGTASAGKYSGAGISLFHSPWPDGEFLDHADGKYTRVKEMFTPAIADPAALPKYISRPYCWFGLPGYAEKDFDKSSFGVPARNVWIVPAATQATSIGALRVVRLFGVTPPEPHLRADGKKVSDVKVAPPPPVAKVTSKPVPPTPQPTPAPAQGQAATKPAAAAEKAPPGEPHPVQHEVEANLQLLWLARWIDKDPGKANQVNDAQSQAAIQDFQEKYLGGKVPHPGHADEATRAVVARYAQYSLGMPVVHVSLTKLALHGQLTKKPGDNALQLDAATKEAVKEFQQKNKLVADGLPGPATQKALAAALASLPPVLPAAPKKDGIDLVYWKRNHGPSGKPVTLLVTGAPDGKALAVSLSQDAKVLVENAGAVTLVAGKGALEVMIPAGLAEGTELAAQVAGVKTQSKFRVQAKATPASKGKVKSGDLAVAGKPFAEWFNNDFQPHHRGDSSILVKGQHLSEFPNKVVAGNFKAFFDSMKAATGEDEISLLRFTAAFCIPYNETGGKFQATIEKGGHAVLPRHAQVLGDKSNLIDFGEVGYFFWGIPGYKSSYNVHDKDGWTWPAGDDLKKRGLISDPLEIERWNGRPTWAGGDPAHIKPYPQPLEDPRYPNPQSEPLKSAQKECHFYKFRGRGLTQTTGREGYMKFANPALVEAGHKKIDELTNAELDQAFADPQVYVAVFRNELITPAGAHRHDFEKVDQDEAILKTIGDRIAGGHTGYGEFYAWRCTTLASAMEEAGWTGG